jgi:hypothetical protein
MDNTEQWGWDLIKNQPVRWLDRGPGDQVLGPYPSRDAALRWREQVEERNTVWDDQDEAWSGDDDAGDAD